MPFQLRLVIELLFTVVADVHHSRELTREEVIEVDVVGQWCQDIGFLLDHNHGQLLLVEGRHVDSESVMTLTVM